MSQNNLHFHRRVKRRQYNRNKGDNNTNDESFPVYNNQEQHHRIAYTRKKPDRLICSICEGPAHGYNFDVITCESCKAFFRRNALKTDEKFQCRANDGQCVITVTTRKRCKACRLAKCFENGMRADWILTDEERMNKRRKIEENRRLRQVLYPDLSDSDQSPYVDLKTEPLETEEPEFCSFLIPSLLSSDDLFKFKRIQQAYVDSIRLTSLPPEIPSYPYTARLDAPWDIMNLPGNLQTSRLITYFKLISEFSSLCEHDKLILIKCNAFALLFVHSTLIYDPISDSYHEPGTDDCVFSGKDLIQCFSLNQYEKSTRCVRRFKNASRNDRLMMQIYLLIILFSKGSSICTYTDELEPDAQDICSINNAQNAFVDLLWKHCENKYGFIKTVNILTELVTETMEAYLQAYNTQHKFLKNDSVADHLVPLMKSVLLVV